MFKNKYLRLSHARDTKHVPYTIKQKAEQNESNQ